MAIIGAILGDISGSRYEHRRPKDLDYKNCDILLINAGLQMTRL